MDKNLQNHLFLETFFLCREAGVSSGRTEGPLRESSHRAAEGDGDQGQRAVQGEAQGYGAQGGGQAALADRGEQEPHGAAGQRGREGAADGGC